MRFPCPSFCLPGSDDPPAMVPEAEAIEEGCHAKKLFAWQPSFLIEDSVFTAAPFCFICGGPSDWEKFADVVATKNKGQIMKAVMADMKGKADGKLINQVVAGLCE